LNSQTKLFQVGSFNFKLNHLVIIGVLVLAFSISFLIRSQPADYGYELNEFDPFFNFRATEYIVENGFSEYFKWRDDKTWYLPLDSSDIGQETAGAGWKKCFCHFSSYASWYSSCYLSNIWRKFKFI